MGELINVYTGLASRAGIAPVSIDDIGISPCAGSCTPYAVHNRVKREGYIGHFIGDEYRDDVSGDFKPENIRRLKRGLTADIRVITLLNNSQDLDILVGGTHVGHDETYLREAIEDVFRKMFPGANFRFEFNDQNRSQCLMYVPKVGLMQFAYDNDAWDGLIE